MSEKPRLTTQEEVMFFDTDCGNVVHNLAYLRMIEVNRTKLGKQLGLTMESMADTRLFPAVVRHEVDYLRAAKIGDTLRIEGELLGVTRSKLLFQFHLYRDSDNTLLVKAIQTLALVQLPEGKPCRIPQEWRDQWLLSEKV